MTTSQTDVFVAGEADGWYERNKQGIANKHSFYDIDALCRTLESFKSEIRSVLEIGCGNGAKLRQLCSFFQCAGSGIDPSPQAVADGNRMFAATEQLQLQVSTADKLPFSGHCFDLVYFGFCLYLVGRDELLQAIAEADRALKSGGFLAITDFDPPQRHKRPYHHKEGVFSYKQSYADLFLASGRYYLVAKCSFSHQDNHFTRDGDERVSLTVLHKELDSYATKTGV